MSNEMHCRPPTLNNTASVKANNIDSATVSGSVFNIRQMKTELFYKTINLPEKAPKLAEKTNDSLFDQETEASLLNTNRPPQVPQQPAFQTPKHLNPKNFKQEGRARVFTITIKYALSRRTFIYVLSCIGQAHRQSMGKKHSRKRLQNIFKSTYAPKFKKKLTNEASTAISEKILALLSKVVIEQVKTGSLGFYNNLLQFVTKPRKNVREYSSGIQQVYRTWIQDQQQEFIDDFHKSYSTLRNDNQFKINNLKCTFKQDLGLKTRSYKNIENR
ncbi:hypothetical protein BB561_006031 [Smittium simulii]|uniref:Uncharacterized protein n=1 Tax=Smittium simulii TaxID=133385 RepID=A0A2T9Y6Z5_9FUNG|nr:hypothetical protein BB561_006031 [Smittium simulii]